MSNFISYDATDHPVHAVTVFQVNRADVSLLRHCQGYTITNIYQINRRIELKLKKGQNEVEINNLPTVLDQDSIRVDGFGSAVIFDVIYSMSQHNVPRRPLALDRESRSTTTSERS